MSLRDDVIATVRTFEALGNTDKNINDMLVAVHNMDGVMRAMYKAGVLEVELSELKVMQKIPVHLRSL